MIKDVRPRALKLLACVLLFTAAREVSPQPQADLTKWTVTIVLPSRVVAGSPATLAVLGVDGKLASDVAVEIGGAERVTTDASGRASFVVPAANVLIAKASGSSAAALVDANLPENSKYEIWAAPIASTREPFVICGSRFRSEADTNHVRLNGEPALVLAASPECLSVMANSKAVPGPAQISVQTPSGQWTAQTTLVALAPEFPKPALLPGQKGRLMVRVRGSEQPLRIRVESQTPGVLRFLKGDLQELLTSGGADNCAAIEVAAIRSGDFSFDARLEPSPDEDAARRYLEAAAALADGGEQRDIKHLVERVAKQPQHNSAKLEALQRDLDKILSRTIEGDLRTLLAAARAAL
jgi:hypothetical protein